MWVLPILDLTYSKFIHILLIRDILLRAVPLLILFYCIEVEHEQEMETLSSTSSYIYMRGGFVATRRNVWFLNK